MRKWLLLILIFLALAIVILYLLIPNNITLASKEGIKVNSLAFYRTIHDEEKWRQWWPGEVLPGKRSPFGSYRYNSVVYTILEKKLNSVVLSLEAGSDTLMTELVFIPVSRDSTDVNWQGSISNSLSPLQRLHTYFTGKDINKDMAVILDRMKKFYAEVKNVYGLKIVENRIVDSTLVSISELTIGYPSVERIYKLIDRLKAFGVERGAKQTGLPMLHVTTEDSISFLTKVALPVDKKLKDEGKIAYRWMLGGGRILVAEVKGGSYNIQRAFAILEKYTEEYNRASPAIPFQSLVTDRRLEPDTSKWVTRVYWPVM